MGDREREASFPRVGRISSGRALCRRGGGGVQSTVGGGMTGFALGAAKVGRAFQRAAGEVGRGSQHRGYC